MRTTLRCALRVAMACYVLILPGILTFVGIEAGHEHSVSAAAAGFAMAAAASLVPVGVLWGLLRLLKPRRPTAEQRTP